MYLLFLELFRGPCSKLAPNSTFPKQLIVCASHLHFSQYCFQMLSGEKPKNSQWTTTHKKEATVFSHIFSINIVLIICQSCILGLCSCLQELVNALLRNCRGCLNSHKTRVLSSLEKSRTVAASPSPSVFLIIPSFRRVNRLKDGWCSSLID